VVFFTQQVGGEIPKSCLILTLDKYYGGEKKALGFSFMLLHDLGQVIYLL
jgi:hypothetical protein